MEEFKTKTQEPYELLLLRDEWKSRREFLIKKEPYCHMCGKIRSDGFGLDVHHKRYIIGRDPWEYPDNDLIVLCRECHKELHDKLYEKGEYVPVYEIDETSGAVFQVERIPCSRCSGAGYLWYYEHVQGGICFKCWGERFEDTINTFKRYADNHEIDITSYGDGYLDMAFFPYRVPKYIMIHYSSSKGYYYAKYPDEKGFLQYADIVQDEELSDNMLLTQNRLRFRERIKGGIQFKLKKNI